MIRFAAEFGENSLIHYKTPTDQNGQSWTIYRVKYNRTHITAATGGWDGGGGGKKTLFDFKIIILFNRILLCPAPTPGPVASESRKTTPVRGMGDLSCLYNNHDNNWIRDDHQLYIMMTIIIIIRDRPIKNRRENKLRRVNFIFFSSNISPRRYIIFSLRLITLQLCCISISISKTHVRIFPRHSVLLCSELTVKKKKNVKNQFFPWFNFNQPISGGNWTAGTHGGLTTLVKVKIILFCILTFRRDITLVESVKLIPSFRKHAPFKYYGRSGSRFVIGDAT